MASKVVRRLTMHVLTSGKVRYYAAYQTERMLKPTVGGVLVDVFLNNYVVMPTRQYQWVIHLWGGGRGMNQNIVAGVTVTRAWRGPYRPEDLYTNEQALNIWRHYAHLLYANRTVRSN